MTGENKEIERSDSKGSMNTNTSQMTDAIIARLAELEATEAQERRLSDEAAENSNPQSRQAIVQSFANHAEAVKQQRAEIEQDGGIV